MRRSFMRPVLILLTVLVAATSIRAADWATEDERWYVMELAGTRTGWLVTITETDGDRIRTTSRSQMSMERGAAPMVIETETVTVEDADGSPLEMISRQSMSSQPVETRWTFHEDHVMVRTTQGGKTMDRRLPRPTGEWLMPAAAGRHMQAELDGGATTVTYRTLDPEFGLDPVTVTSSRTGEATYERDGADVPVTVWSSTSDVLPLVSTEMYDADGVMLHSEMDIGIGTIVTRLSTKALATRALDGAAAPVMTKTFVRPDTPMRDPYTSTRARMRLRTADGQPMPTLPTAASQVVTTTDSPSEILLDVDIHREAPATDEDLSNPEYIEPSMMVDADDSLVKALSKSACRQAGDDPMDRAEAMRRKVYTHISSKNLDTAFAGASEVARRRSGDCSEHGVLLCAMLRADGIPARVATGLVYADGFLGERDIFGWHMWTQALIDGNWVDFDATLPTRYNASHVLTGTASLADGSGESDLMAVLILMGNLEIAIESESSDRE